MAFARFRGLPFRNLRGLERSFNESLSIIGKSLTVTMEVNQWR